MKKIGFGIIGFGRQGLRLAEHIRKDIDHAKLVAVCRRSKDGQEYSKKHGINFYSNHQDLLMDKWVDAVIIATPSNLHGVQALEALRAKKHILIDKPIASTIEQGRKIRAQAKKHNLTVAVNLPLRVNPVTETIKNNLGHIGKIKKIQLVVCHGAVRSAWQNNIDLSNGGVILDLGSHYFDLISFLTGSQPVTIENASSEETDNENSGFIDITYKKFSASIVLLRNQKFKKSTMTFAGDKGLLYADYYERKVIVSTSHEVNEIQCPNSQDFLIILNNLIRAINNKEDVIADSIAGINSLKTSLSAYQWIKDRKPV